MPAISRPLKPGETIFGGGAGVILLGSRQAAATRSESQTQPSDTTQTIPHDPSDPAQRVLDAYLRSHNETQEAEPKPDDADQI